MNILLIGYMASGKSTVGGLLAKSLRFNFLDLDKYIEERETNSLDIIFKEKGELYFRKKESFYLEQVLKDIDSTVIALGGGTPCYGNNINTILKDKNSLSVYLKVSVNTLSRRILNQKETRPLVKHLKTNEEVNEFVAKHLFERQFYYNQADFTVDVETKSKSEIVEFIVLRLF